MLTHRPRVGFVARAGEERRALCDGADPVPESSRVTLDPGKVVTREISKGDSPGLDMGQVHAVSALPGCQASSGRGTACATVATRQLALPRPSRRLRF